MKKIQDWSGVDAFSPEGREAMKWWFSEEPKIVKERDEYCKKKEEERNNLRNEGYVILCGDTAYTEQDILDGKCPLNGTLYNMGYRRVDDYKWRKKLPDEE